jgi:hypothetical protein
MKDNGVTGPRAATIGLHGICMERPATLEK